MGQIANFFCASQPQVQPVPVIQPVGVNLNLGVPNNVEIANNQVQQPVVQ